MKNARYIKEDCGRADYKLYGICDLIVLDDKIKEAGFGSKGWGDEHGT